MSRIYKNKWNEWLLEFDTFMKNITENKNAQKCADGKIIINNFDNKKYKKFMILSFILKNKNIIKNNLNKKEEHIKIIQHEQNKFIPYGTLYKGYHGQRKISKGPCENVDCPNEKRNVYNRLCKKCYSYSNGKYNPNNDFNDAYTGDDYTKIDELVKEYTKINNISKICKHEFCERKVPNNYNFCIKHKK
jgi:hypothetical protein